MEDKEITALTREYAGGMNPLNIRFRAKSLKDGAIVTGFYCRHEYGENFNGRGEPPLTTHDIWCNSPKGWVEIDPATLEVFEMAEQKSLFDEIAKEVEK